MTKLNSIITVASGYLSQQQINANFVAIQALWEDNLSRSGTVPNFMDADLDMNSNEILNAVFDISQADGILPIANGGTGASTASTARDNLGLTIGNNVQAYSALLANIASLSVIPSGKILYTTSNDTFSTSSITSFGRTLIALADAAALASLINVTIVNEDIDDRVANLLVAGTGITLTYNDIANTLTIDATATGSVTSVSGTSNRITSSGGTTPVIDISASYVGQSSITTLGTIATGVWQGTAIGDTYISSASTWNAKQPQLNGTGFVKATGTTISYDNSTYLTTASATSTYQPLDSTLTAFAAYNTNGILTQTSADTFTGRTITGTTNFIDVTNGSGVSGNPTLTVSSTYAGGSSITTTGTVTSGTWSGSFGSVSGANLTGVNGATVSSANEATDTTCFPLFITASGTQTLATKNNTSLTFNSNTANLGCTTFTGALVGNASTATSAATLTTPRAIGGVNFDGSGAIVPQTIQSINEATDTTCFPLFISASGSQSLQPLNNTSLTFNANTANLGCTTFTGALVGNASTATTAAAWTTARNLAGNSVSGSANVAFANKFIVQGTTDAGLSAAQFLGALATGIVKNTTTTGALSIASAGTDYADNAFKTISVSGQSDVVADSAADTLTLVAGTNMTITTNASTDTITLTASGGAAAAGGSNTQVQYNNSTALGGITNATSDGTTMTLTSPKIITAINDTNANELFKFTSTASAVNEITIANNSTGLGPIISSTGNDANIDLQFQIKGIGTYQFQGTSTQSAILKLYENTGNGTNYIGLTAPSSIAADCFISLPGITATLAATNIAQTFTQAQRGAFSALTDGATITPDFSLANNFIVVLGGNRTLAVPTNLVAGQSGVISVYQDITGSRTLAYQWAYQFPNGGTAPTLSTGKLVFDQLIYNVNKYATSTVTMTLASPCVITWTAHGLNSGDRIQLTTSGALPTGVSASTTYWITKVDADSFKISSSLANAQAATFINSSVSQSGTHTATNISISIASNLNMV